MRILIDILTPKQCRFFSALSKKLERRGFEVFKTARRFREVVELLGILGEEAYIVGRYGGATLEGKLDASLERMLELKKVFHRLKPDLVVSFSSPEASRIAFGLGTPHIAVNDSPHSEAVARLTIPLSRILFTPWIIPKAAWTRYGIAPSRIIKYRALDPAAWLKEFKPDPRVLTELGLDTGRPIAVFRLEESHASYILGMGGLVEEVAKKALERFDLQLVIMPRYDEQVNRVEKVFGDKALVLRKTVDAASLLYFASILVGGGGTMNIEAALLGVPVVSCYPGQTTYVERYLVEKGFIRRASNPDEALAHMEKLLEPGEKARFENAAKKTLRAMVNPAEFIAEKLGTIFS
ncbi:lipid-A-disaccharide synthase [Candidatus Bathyarchaeota archaeon]|nr:MAG: lipid-A-disaccharide synthase [Candidatus Bathyarchaeota archaeon]